MWLFKGPIAEGLSKSNYDRAKAQYEQKVIPQESFQTYQENYKTAQLQTQIAKKRVDAARANIESSTLQGEASKANIETIKSDLAFYRVTSPVDGIIGKRWNLAGNFVTAGQTVFTINSGDEIWVAVNLEETKFQNIYLGQEAEINLSAYGDLTFYGKIYYIGDNAASEFSLVPASNASGNFTKVTQRIPLKISIDRVEGNEKAKKNVKLVSGMSANVKIIKDK